MKAHCLEATRAKGLRGAPSPLAQLGPPSQRSIPVPAVSAVLCGARDDLCATGPWIMPMALCYYYAVAARHIHSAQSTATSSPTFLPSDPDGE